MAKHEFGIMKIPPQKGKSYETYNPQKYHCISVNDDDLVNILASLESVDFYWHSLGVPGKGLAYCGISLIPPASMQAFISAIGNLPELSELKALLQKAHAENKWIIHFGL